MKKSMVLKLILLVMAPMIVGEIINRSLSYGIKLNSQFFWSITSMFLYSWQIGSIIFWFLVGKQFGGLKMNKVKSFILGNIVWGISLALYIWQFLFQETNRNLYITLISQHYVLGFVSWSSKLITLFTNSINGVSVLILAYFMMLAVFILGFKSASYS